MYRMRFSGGSGSGLSTLPTSSGANTTNNTCSRTPPPPWPAGVKSDANPPASSVSTEPREVPNSAQRSCGERLSFSSSERSTIPGAALESKKAT